MQLEGEVNINYQFNLTASKEPETDEVLPIDLPIVPEKLPLVILALVAVLLFTVWLEKEDMVRFKLPP